MPTTAANNVRVMKKPSIVFFDLDETLIINDKNPMQHLASMYDSHICHLIPSGSGFANDEEGSREIFKKAMLSYAKNLWFDIFLPNKDGIQVLGDMFTNALVSIQLPADIVPLLVADFLSLATRNTRASIGAIETLEQLKALNIKTGLITNGFTELQLAKLHHVGLSDLVDIKIVSEDAGAHKPEKTVFEYALRHAGINAADAWHVGDHPTNDIRGAMACDITGIFYDPTSNRLAEEFVSDEPDCTVKALADVSELALAST